MACMFSNFLSTNSALPNSPFSGCRILENILPNSPKGSCQKHSDKRAPLLSEKADKLREFYVVKTDDMCYTILSISYGGAI